jgi:agmatinase
VDGARAGAAGALARANELCAELNAHVRTLADHHLGAGRVVAVVGGDHATPFANIAAHIERYPEVGLLHIDAHADLRDAYEGFAWSHASILHNVMTRLPAERLVQVGVRDYCASERQRIESDERITTFFATDVAAERFGGAPWARLVDTVVAALPTEVYVTFDIDGLDPAYCPETGTPVPGGLSYDEAVYLLRTVIRSGRRVVGFDLCEVATAEGADPATAYDGNVGARILYQLCIAALVSRP